MKHVESRGLQPCQLSAHCQRFVDEMDLPRVSQQGSGFIDDIGDERLLAQLRTHVPTCPTCTAALAQARSMRSQQRAALRDLLADSEQRVPSTRAQVSLAIGREQRAPLPLGNHYQELRIAPSVQLEPLPGMPLSGKERQWTGFLSSRRPRVVFRNVLALATVAAVILVAIGLFSRYNVLHPATAPTGPDRVVDSWNSVVIALVFASHMTIANYDPVSGKSVSLVKSPLPADTQIDGVSHDGRNLLYQFSTSGHTEYFTLSQLPNTGFFYELNDSDAGNAVWMTDSRHVLIATAHSGIVEVDTQTGTWSVLLPSLNNARLTFYRDGFLYFIGAENRATGALYRVNIITGVIQQVTMRSPGSIFWLSPDGSTVFYANKGSAGEQGIYAVSSDGMHSRILRHEDGIPIGYAADNALMLLREVNGKFEVVKLGATPQQQDSTVLADAAPGGPSIQDTDVALAPYGHALIVQGTYADGSHEVWSDDLTTGKQHVLLSPDSATQVQLQGWDRILVA